MDVLLAAAVELARATVDALTAAGVTPGPVSISDKEGDWLPRSDEDGGCSGCEQVVIVPATSVIPVDNFGSQGFGLDKGGWRKTVQYRVIAAWCVDESLDQWPGDVFLPPDAKENAGTAWAEAGQLVIARSVLTSDRLLKRWAAYLCASPDVGYGTPILVGAASWTEGGCAGTDMTVAVDL